MELTLSFYLFGFFGVLLIAWGLQLIGHLDSGDAELGVFIFLSLLPYVNTTVVLLVMFLVGLTLIGFIIYLIFSLPSIIIKRWS